MEHFVGRRLLGGGKLSWNADERRSDRYGSVGLFSGDNTKRLEKALELQGTYGQLVAEVVETRKSTHIGDLARGIKPSTPNVGEILTLGEGVFFVRDEEEDFYVGLKPNDGRETDWLNPHILYKLHSQTVLLFFESKPPS